MAVTTMIVIAIGQIKVIQATGDAVSVFYAADTGIEEVKAAVGALREQLEKNQQDPAIMEKVNATLDAHEEKNQELTTQLKAREKAETELKEQVESLEGEISRKSSGRFNENSSI